MKVWIPWGIVVLAIGSGIEALVTHQYTKAGYWFAVGLVNGFVIFI